MVSLASQLGVSIDFNLYIPTREESSNLIKTSEKIIYLQKRGNLLDYETETKRQAVPKTKEEKLARFVLDYLIPARETRLIGEKPHSIIGSIIPKDFLLYKDTINRIKQKNGLDQSGIYIDGRKYGLHGDFSITLSKLDEIYMSKISTEGISALVRRGHHDKNTGIGFRIIDGVFYVTHLVEPFVLEDPSGLYKFSNAELGVILDLNWKGDLFFSNKSYLLTRDFIHPSVNGDSGIRKICLGSYDPKIASLPTNETDLADKLEIYLHESSAIFKCGYNEYSNPYSRLSDPKYQRLRVSKNRTNRSMVTNRGEK